MVDVDVQNDQQFSADMALSEFSENQSLAMEEKKEVKINLMTKQD